ncbi:MAG: arylsulfatase [Acidimicrobiales bacterium]
MVSHAHLNTHPDGSPFPGVAAQSLDGSSGSWPVPEQAPEGAPNIVFIVLDDLGYAQLGCYGGLGGRIRTPNIDRLAAGGLRYRNFHTTALCSPTRAALLTGRNHHSVGLGTIVERATAFPGYHARIPKDSAMLPKVLGANGWSTYCVGKWHLTPDEHNGPTGPFDRWPLGQGFDRYYGFLSGETDQWHPDLWEDNHRVDPPPTPGYHLTADLADRAIRWIGEHRTIDSTRPFFLHFATGAPHSPHHAPRDLIESYAGVFDDGWDVIREQTLAAQIDLGVVPEGTDLPPRNQGVRAWSELSDTERRVYCRQMEVYAAFVEHTDREIGRLLEFLQHDGCFDNTIVMLMSDNGASAEGGQHGLVSEITYFNGRTESIDDMVERLDDWGGPTTYPHYAHGWAYAGSTPQKWYKGFVHEGGTRDPLIVSWPAGIGKVGEVRDQFHHVVDIASTIYELTGVQLPDTVDGVDQRPLEGVSMAYSFGDAGAPSRKQRQYFEMFAHRAIWADGWKAVTMHPGKAAAPRIPGLEVREGRFEEDVWELYHLAEDFSEAHDLATQHPEKLLELQQLWHEDALRYNVYPLDDRALERASEPRPRVVERRDEYVFSGPIRLVRSVSPNIINRSHNIEVDFEFAPGVEGVLMSNGGLQGGYTLCVSDGHLVYVSNYLGRDTFVVRSVEPIPPGRHTAIMSFEKTQPFAGEVTLWLDGHMAGQGSVERTNPIIYSVGEGLEVGSDAGTPVWSQYQSPFTFTGRLHRAVLRTNGPISFDGGAEDRIAMYRQ